MFSLSGKVALVTGSSRGIGKAIAGALAEAGARVVVSSRKADACERAAEELRAAGGEALALPCNVSDPNQIDALVEGTLARLEAIDVLVCNAAANPYFGPLLEIGDEAYDKIMTTNVEGALRLCRRVIPGMAARGGGSVIVVSSIAGLKGTRNLGAYAMSKAALMQLVRNLALEWGSANVRVNAIAPGLVRTDFARALWENPKAYAQAVEGYPLGRIGEPEDIAGAAVFLASRAGAFVTGQTLVVDGGATVASGQYS